MAEIHPNASLQTDQGDNIKQNQDIKPKIMEDVEYNASDVTTRPDNQHTLTSDSALTSSATASTSFTTNNNELQNSSQSHLKHAPTCQNSMNSVTNYTDSTASDQIVSTPTTKTNGTETLIDPPRDPIRKPYLIRHEQRTSLVGLRDDWDDAPRYLIEADTEDNRMCYLSRSSVRKFLQRFIAEARRLKGWEVFDMPVNINEFDDYRHYVKRPLCFDDLDKELEYISRRGISFETPGPDAPLSIGYSDGKESHLYLRTVRDFIHAWNQIWVNCHLYTADLASPVRQYAESIAQKMYEKWHRSYANRVPKQRCDTEGSDYCCACGSGKASDDIDNNIVFCGSEDLGCGRPFHQKCAGGCGPVVPQADWLCDDCVECGAPQYATSWIESPDVDTKLRETGETMIYRRLGDAHNQNETGDTTRVDVHVPYTILEYDAPEIGWVTTDTQFTRLSPADQHRALRSSVRVGFELNDSDLSTENLRELRNQIAKQKATADQLLTTARHAKAALPPIHPEGFTCVQDVNILNIIRACGEGASSPWISYNVTHVHKGLFLYNWIEAGALCKRVEKILDQHASGVFHIFSLAISPRRIADELHIHENESKERLLEGGKSYKSVHNLSTLHRSNTNGSLGGSTSPSVHSSNLMKKRPHHDTVDHPHKRFCNDEHTTIPSVDWRSSPREFVTHLSTNTDDVATALSAAPSSIVPRHIWDEVGLFDGFFLFPNNAQAAQEISAAFRSA